MNEFVKTALENLLHKNESLIVAIDGPSGAGKTALACEIEKNFNCNIFHTDDFFLPPFRKTEERLAEPGGNIDYERLRDEIIIPLIGEKTVCFKRFDCTTGEYGPMQKYEAKKLTVIEGVYSMHPYLEYNPDLRIYLDIDKETQHRRIFARNGPEISEIYQNKWIPIENMYFKSFNIKNRCDIIIKNNDFFTKSLQFL